MGGLESIDRSLVYTSMKLNDDKFRFDVNEHVEPGRGTSTVDERRRRRRDRERKNEDTECTGEDVGLKHTGRAWQLN